MENITISHGEWWKLNINLQTFELTFLNKLNETERVYTCKEEPKSLEIENEYVTLFLLNTYWVIKFESDEDLVIDEYDYNDEFLNEIGCYNIYDFDYD